MKDKDFRKVSIKVMADADSGEADAVMSEWLKGQSGVLRADILVLSTFLAKSCAFFIINCTA